MKGPAEISRDRADYDHWTTLVPRYSDQDPMQHINNVSVAAYLEAGRVNLITPLLEACSGTTTAMVLARVTIDFLGELHYPDEVQIGGRLVELGNRSMRSHYALFQNGKCCVVSESVNVFFNIETRKSAAPPDHVAAMIRRRIDAR